MYTTSTRGRSLDDEGFIHAAYEWQVEDVANRYYADVDELVLLKIDSPTRSGRRSSTSHRSGTRLSEQFPAHLRAASAVAAVVDGPATGATVDNPDQTGRI